jgi:hypothetical protein
VLCRTKKRIGQLAQAEPGKQTTEARALDAKLGGRPRDGLVDRSAVLRVGIRGIMRGWSLSHAKPFCKVWHYPAALPNRDSIMTPRIRGEWSGLAPVEIWISKPLSYTMLPSHARARFHPVATWPAVARGPQGGCIVPPQLPGGDRRGMPAPKLWRRSRDPRLHGPDRNYQVSTIHDLTNSHSPRTTPAVKVGTVHPAVPTPWPPIWRIEIRPPTRRWY